MVRKYYEEKNDFPDVRTIVLGIPSVFTSVDVDVWLVMQLQMYELETFRSGYVSFLVIIDS